MQTISTLQRSLAAQISDRGFRVFCVLVLHPSGEWRDIPSIAAAVQLNPHQIRHAITELCGAGLIEKERRYESGASGRKTWHTYVRPLDDDLSSASPAAVPTEAAA